MARATERRREDGDQRRAGDRLLAIFLQDHLAALRGAVELGNRVKASHDEGWVKEAAETFLRAVIDDRRELLRVARQVGVEPSLPKEASAWFAEKVGRLKLNGRLTERSPLTLVVELEAMCLFAAEREILWRALVPTARARPELSLHPSARAASAREHREELLSALAIASERVLPGPDVGTVHDAVRGTEARGANGDAASPS